MHNYRIKGQKIRPGEPGVSYNLFFESAAGFQQHVQLAGGIAVVLVFVAAGDEHGVLAVVAVADVGIDPALEAALAGIAQLPAHIAAGVGVPRPCVIAEYLGAEPIVIGESFLSNITK